MTRRRPPLLLRLGPAELATDLARDLARAASALRLALLCLPRRAALLVAFLVVDVAAPTVLQVLALVGALNGVPLAYVGERPVLAWALAALAGGAAVVAYERPRTWSLAAYGRQLSVSAGRVRLEYHAALRRRFPQQSTEE